MKKAALKLGVFILVLFFLVFIYLKNSHYYSSYNRVKELYNYQIENALALDKIVEGYFIKKLTFPRNKNELDRYIEQYGPDYLSDNLSKIEYHVTYENNQFSIHDFGFDDDNDSLKSLLPHTNPGFLRSLFENGDFLIYIREFQEPQKLLFSNYFVYDSTHTIIPGQEIFNDQITETRNKILNDYYLNNFNLKLSDVYFNPGEKPDTVLVHGLYRNKIWNLEVLNALSNNRLNVNVFDSLFNSIKITDSRVSEFYITVLIASSKSKLLIE